MQQLAEGRIASPRHDARPRLGRARAFARSGRKALYVWLDAPIGYISATKQWAKDHNTDWEKWWKADDTRLLHFIGKDNIVFHCIIFPILLKEHGDFILPQNVPANEFLNLEGRKLSTSRNWAVWLHEYIERWPNRQDELRYALTTIFPEFKDSEFTWKDFQDKNNNELVAIIGNFVQRIFVLCHKYYDGKVPEPVGIQRERKGNRTPCCGRSFPASPEKSLRTSTNSASAMRWPPP
jgi:methionyl-tRNA synthetase